jgi:hydrogenase/urease accessory protein HupE
MMFLVLPAYAHRPGLSYAHTDGLTLILTFAKPELAILGPMADLDAARLLIAKGTIEKLQLQVDGKACSFGAPSIAEVENDGVEIQVALDCPSGSSWSYQADFLVSPFEPGHRHYLEAFGSPVGVLDAGNNKVAFTGEAPTGGVAGKFLMLGVEHIWTGYDHLLFLAGLLLAASRLKEMLMIVTGFTVAHSITLSLSALDVVRLSPEVVEPAIAASIAWVGLENLVRPPARRRVLLTFVLGLVHGFGFAGLLAELGIPRGSLLTVLLSFNGGVELGQAAVVMVLLPVLLWLRRIEAWEKRAIPILSLVVAGMGFYWMIERLA